MDENNNSPKAEGADYGRNPPEKVKTIFCPYSPENQPSIIVHSIKGLIAEVQCDHLKGPRCTRVNIPCKVLKTLEEGIKKIREKIREASSSK